jgi:hypothetical protein
LARAAERPCVRPGCPAPAQASLTFRYASREAWVERLSAEPTPEAYDLCQQHASRTQPPHGWQLRDRRPREEQIEQEPQTETRRDLGGEDTVAVLAAALRAVPEAAPQPAEAVVEVEPEPDADPEAPLLEEATSPVLEQPRVPGLGSADGDGGDVTDVRPRPVPAARDRGIEAPVDRSSNVPHGTARDW